MGTRLINQPLLLNLAAPLDARSHFTTLLEASKKINDQPDPNDTSQTISVVTSSANAEYSAGVYVNYYYGQVITTEQDGLFVVCSKNDHGLLNNFIQVITDATAVIYAGGTIGYSWNLLETSWCKAASGTSTSGTVSFDTSIFSFYDFVITSAVLKITGKDADVSYSWEFQWQEAPTPYLKLLTGSGGGGYVLPVASTTILGGIKLAEEQAQADSKAALPIFLQGDKAYADLPPIEEKHLSQTLLDRVHFISAVDEETFKILDETLYLQYVNGGSADG